MMLRTSDTSKNRFKAYLFLSIGVTLLNLGVATLPVKAVTFQETTRGVLEFRDNNGQIVGTGMFNYSPTPLSVIFVAGILRGTPEPVFGFFNDSSSIPFNWIINQQIQISESEDLHLTNVSVNFNHSAQTYNFSNFSDNNYFFKPPASSILPRSDVLSTITVSRGRTGYYISQIFDQWFYQSPYSGVPEILIDGDGSFYLYDFDTDITLTGTWTARATAIPEPLTIIGATTATVFGAFFKRKLFKERFRRNPLQ